MYPDLNDWVLEFYGWKVKLPNDYNYTNMPQDALLKYSEPPQPTRTNIDITDDNYYFGGLDNGSEKQIPVFSNYNNDTVRRIGDVSGSGTHDVSDVAELVDALIFGTNTQTRDLISVDMYTGEPTTTMLKPKYIINYMNFLNN